MVHALREAHRVLKPNGSLIDMRPAAEHRRVGIARRGRWREIARLNEIFADDRAANRAVERMLHDGLFKRGTEIRFEVNRYADTIQDFRDWLNDFTDLKPSPRLISKVERILAAQPEETQIVVRGPLVVQILRKM